MTNLSPSKPGLSFDTETFLSGNTYPVTIHNTLLSTGWVGGQGVMWTQGPVPTVTCSDGRPAGFLLYGSAEPPHFSSDHISKQRYGISFICFDNWVVAVRAFERYTWLSRQSGPLVHQTYNPSQRLRFSLRGLWTAEDEWSLTSDFRGLNSVVGTVVADLGTHLVVQANI